MSDFFADQTSTVDVEFPEDGVVITMRQYLDAGIREEAKKQMLRLTVSDGEKTNGNGNSPSAQEARFVLGDFFVLSKMITRVQLPPGHPVVHIPVSNGFLGRLKPEAIQRLVGVVNENNPLADPTQDEELTEAQVELSESTEPTYSTETSAQTDGTGGSLTGPKEPVSPSPITPSVVS